jgi:hypothetical protein
LGAFECGNESLGSIKFGIFLEKLRTCVLLRKVSALWTERERDRERERGGGGRVKETGQKVFHAIILKSMRYGKKNTLETFVTEILNFQ